jgi:hypothetical protein
MVGRIVGAWSLAMLTAVLPAALFQTDGFEVRHVGDEAGEGTAGTASARMVEAKTIVARFIRRAAEDERQDCFS